MRSFAETPLNQPVQYKVRQIVSKMELLDREVKYLLNKVKIRKPKQESNTASNKTERPIEEAKESEVERENETSKTDTEISDTEEDTEEIVLAENDKSQTSDRTQVPEEDEHQEL